jgi:hypothetical protein
VRSQSDSGNFDPSPRLIEGYTAMASDHLREREAEEWCEALIVST